jgi:arsenite methyltransferase
MPAAKANYGIDAPGRIMALVVVGIASSFAGIFIGSAAGLGAGVGPWLLAVVLLALAVAMIVTSKVVKPHRWARELDALDLRGDERALDAGCGRGVVTVALAQRLPEGSVVGVDIWRNRDQSGNSKRNALLNVQLLGLVGRVEVRDADVTRLPFPDASFDVVTASLVLGTMRTSAERQAALDELARVTRPGGRVVVADDRRVSEAEARLRAAGWVEVARRRSVIPFAGVSLVRATKPIEAPQ